MNLNTSVRESRCWKWTRRASSCTKETAAGSFFQGKLVFGVARTGWPWYTTRVSPSNLAAGRVATLKQFVVLFIAASHTPGPNFVDRDKIIFGTSERGRPSGLCANHIAYLPPALGTLCRGNMAPANKTGVYARKLLEGVYLGTVCPGRMCWKFNFRFPFSTRRRRLVPPYVDVKHRACLASGKARGETRLAETKPECNRGKYERNNKFGVTRYIAPFTSHRTRV